MKSCPHGDELCPCPDGDPCHYEGENPMISPKEIRVHGASVCVNITPHQIKEIKTIDDIESIVGPMIEEAALSLKELIRWKLDLEEHEW